MVVTRENYVTYPYWPFVTTRKECPQGLAPRGKIDANREWYCICKGTCNAHYRTSTIHHTGAWAAWAAWVWARSVGSAEAWMAVQEAREECGPVIGCALLAATITMQAGLHAIGMSEHRSRKSQMLGYGFAGRVVTLGPSLACPPP